MYRDDNLLRLGSIRCQHSRKTCSIPEEDSNETFRIHLLILGLFLMLKKSQIQILAPYCITSEALQWNPYDLTSGLVMVVVLSLRLLLTLATLTDLI